MAREFAWDRRSQRYRITSGAGRGSFISREAVDNLTEQYIEASKVEIDSITNQLLNGEIGTFTWERAIAQQIKDINVNSYALGRGGFNQLDSRDLGLIGSRIRSEYGYLREFSREIAAGQLSEAQILDRVSMYVDAAAKFEELGRNESHRAEGFDEERRIAVDDGQSCSPCLDYANQGWQPIGTLPNRGQDCDCRSRCRCWKEYRKSGEASNSFRLLQSSGWVGHSVKHRLGAIAQL
jgi:hypothetical protein